MGRSRIWLQVLSAWMPVWALYSALVFTMHQPTSLWHAAIMGGRGVLPAALLGLLVHRLATRVRWPQRFSLTFILVHVIAALAYATTWMLSVGLIESALRGHLAMNVGPGAKAFLLLAVWLYVIVAGISYAVDASERAAHAEATTTRMQLAALRAQLHPHFLFNALHTVVQLIPIDPARAAEAAEQVAQLLRTTIEEDRDIVSLDDEWTFVSRYLDIERIRFGDRLSVRAKIDERLRGALVPSFALQTLVENAVRHGAAPRVAPTEITITATSTSSALTLCVHDTGDGATAEQMLEGGTGLARLRERLTALYGGAAQLLLMRGATGGFAATLLIPRPAEDDE